MTVRKMLRHGGGCGAVRAVWQLGSVRILNQICGRPVSGGWGRLRRLGSVECGRAGVDGRLGSVAWGGWGRLASPSAASAAVISVAVCVGGWGRLPATPRK